MNIFKIEYHWYEGDYSEDLLGKNVEREEFERDLLKAKEFAVSLIGNKIKDFDYLGKGYRVECLPEYYEQILWFLVNKKEYIQCSIKEDISYIVDDHAAGKKIGIIRSENHIKRHELGKV